MYLEDEVKKLKNDFTSLADKVNEIDAALALKSSQTFLSTKEAAKRLNKSRAAVLDQIRKGKINAVKTSPTSEHSRYKISEAEINRVLNLKTY